MNPQEKEALKGLATRMVRKYNMVIEQLADFKESLDMVLAVIGQVTKEEAKKEVTKK